MLKKDIWEYNYSITWNQKTKYWTLKENSKIRGQDIGVTQSFYFKNLIELRKNFIKILDSANFDTLCEMKKEKADKEKNKIKSLQASKFNKNNICVVCKGESNNEAGICGPCILDGGK